MGSRVMMGAAVTAAAFLAKARAEVPLECVAGIQRVKSMYESCPYDCGPATDTQCAKGQSTIGVACKEVDECKTLLDSLSAADQECYGTHETTYTGGVRGITDEVLFFKTECGLTSDACLDAEVWWTNLEIKCAKDDGSYGATCAAGTTCIDYVETVTREIINCHSDVLAKTKTADEVSADLATTASLCDPACAGANAKAAMFDAKCPHDCNAADDKNPKEGLPFCEVGQQAYGVACQDTDCPAHIASYSDAELACLPQARISTLSEYKAELRDYDAKCGGTPYSPPPPERTFWTDYYASAQCANTCTAPVVDATYCTRLKSLAESKCLNSCDNFKANFFITSNVPWVAEYVDMECGTKEEARAIVESAKPTPSPSPSPSPSNRPSLLPDDLDSLPSPPPKVAVDTSDAPRTTAGVLSLVVAAGAAALAL